MAGLIREELEKREEVKEKIYRIPLISMQIKHQLFVLKAEMGMC